MDKRNIQPHQCSFTAAAVISLMRHNFLSKLRGGVLHFNYFYLHVDAFATTKSRMVKLGPVQCFLAWVNHRPTAIAKTATMTGPQ